MTTAEVVAAVKELTPAVVPYTRIVGRWVWIETLSKPEAADRDCLKYLGFHWNNKRKAWQHPCGFECPSAPYDPRDKYRSIKIDELVEA